MKKESIIFTVLMVLCASAYAGSGTWNNAAGGAWGTASNWLNGVIPSGSAENDVAYLPNLSQPYAITHTGTTKLNGFSVSAGADATVSGGIFELYGLGWNAQKRGAYLPAGSTFSLLGDILIAGNIPFEVWAGSDLTTRGFIRNDASTNVLWVVKKGDGTWKHAGKLDTKQIIFGVTRGRFELLSGGEITGGNGANVLAIARAEDEWAEVIVHSGATWKMSDNLNIQIGEIAKQFGRFIVDGGTVQQSRWLVGNKASGSFIAQNGADVSVGIFRIGSQKPGTLTVKGGSTVKTWGFEFGDWSATSTNGLVSVEDGTFHVTSKMRWKSGNALNQMVVRDGGLFSFPAGDTNVLSKAGTSQLVLDGGTAELTGVAYYGASVDDYGHGLDEIRVLSSGKFQVPAGVAATIKEPVVGESKAIVEKTGTGSLMLTTLDPGIRLWIFREGALGFTAPEGTLGTRFFADGALALENGIAQTISIQNLETVALDKSATFSLDLSETIHDSLVFKKTADLAGKRIRIRLAKGMTGANIPLFSWEGVAAPALVEVIPPTGYTVTTMIDAAAKRAFATISFQATTGLSQWILPGSGSWADAASWTSLPTAGSEVFFSSALQGAATVALSAPTSVARLTYDAPYETQFDGAALTVTDRLHVKQGSVLFQKPLAAMTVKTEETGKVIAAGGISGAMELYGDLTLRGTSAAQGAVMIRKGGIAIKDTATGGEGLSVIVPHGLEGILRTEEDVAFTGSFMGGTLVKAGKGRMTLPAAGKGSLRVDAGIAKLSAPASFDQITVQAGQITFPTSVTRVEETPLTMASPDGAHATVLDVQEDLVWDGPFSASGPFVKTGAGTLFLDHVVGTQSDSYNAGEEIGHLPIAFDPETLSVKQGHRDVTVLNGKIRFSPESSNQITIAGCLIAGGWSTTEGVETAGHIEFLQGKYTFNDWLTIGRNNGNTTTAPDGLESTLTFQEGAEGWARGIWLASQTGSFSGSTSKARLIMNGGEIGTDEITIGNKQGNGLARPVIEVNGGQLLAKKIHLANDTGWTGTLQLNGGIFATENAINIRNEGRGIVNWNGGTWQANKSLPLNGTKITHSLYPNGAFLATAWNWVTLQLNAPFEPVEGGGPVTFMGAGTLYLTQSQVYTNETRILAGKLIVSNGVSLAASPLILAKGTSAEFGGTNPTIGDLTVANDTLITLTEGAVLTVNGAITGAPAFRMVDTDGNESIQVGKTIPLATFTGAAPDLTGWQFLSAPDAVFSVEGQTVSVTIPGVVPTTWSVWQTPGAGLWTDAANWDVVPSTPAAVQFAGNPTEDATVTLPAAGVDVAGVEQTAPVTVTWAGGVTRFAPDAVLLQQAGMSDFADPVQLNGKLIVAAAETAKVGFSALSGVGPLIQKGGTLILTNETDTATVEMTEGTVEVAGGTSRYAYTLHDAAIAPKAGETVELAGVLTGKGEVTKKNISGLTVTGLSALEKLFVQSGLYESAILPSALKIGDGTFRYTGPYAEIATLQIASSAPSVSTIEVAEPTTVVSVTDSLGVISGALCKTGPGTLRLAPAAGLHTLAMNHGAADASQTALFGPFGTPPETGTRSVNVFNGTMIIEGDPDAVMDGFNTTIIGGATTTNGIETAAHLVIKSGEYRVHHLAIGRGNGTTNTAPIPLQSSVTVEGGKLHLTSNRPDGDGLYVGMKMKDQEDCNARPFLRQTGGEFIVSGGVHVASSGAKSTHFTATFTAGKSLFCRVLSFAETAGSGTDWTLSGTADQTLCAESGEVWFCRAGATEGYASTSTLRLDGGVLRAPAFRCAAGGTGEVILNGGQLIPLHSGTLLPTESGRITVTTEAGGAWFTTETGIVSRVETPISGEGGVRKTGGGELVLAGTNTYTGATSVEEGTLTLEKGNAASDLTVAGLGSVVLPNTTFACKGLTMAGTLSVTDGTTIHATGAVDLTGATLQLRTFPSTTYGKEILLLESETGVTGVDSVTIDSAYQATLRVAGNQVYLLISGSSLEFNWNAISGGAWATVENWWNAQAPGAGMPGAAILFGGSAQTAAETVVDTPVTFGTIAFNNANSHAITATGTGALIPDGNDDSAVIQSVTGSHRISAPIQVEKPLDLQSAESSSLSLEGELSGTAPIHVKANSDVTFRGANPYLGEMEAESESKLTVEGMAPLGLGTVQMRDRSTIRSEKAGIVENRATILVTSGASQEINVGFGPTNQAGTLVQKAPMFFKNNTGNMKLISINKWKTGTWRIGGEVTQQDVNTRLCMHGGTVVIDGSDVTILRKDNRASIEFDMNFTSQGGLETSKRNLIIENGGRLTTGGIFQGGDAPAGITVRNEGVLDVIGTGNGNIPDGLTVGNRRKEFDVNVLSDGALYVTNKAIWTSIGAWQAPAKMKVDHAQAIVANLGLGMRDLDADRERASATILITNNALMDVTYRMNWMSDATPTRTNLITVTDGAELRLPRTERSVTIAGQWAELLLDGGSLTYHRYGCHTPGEAGWLIGLDRLAIGENGGILSAGTFPNELVIAQRIQSVGPTGTVLFTSESSIRLMKRPDVGGGMKVISGTTILAESEEPGADERFGLKATVYNGAVLSNAVSQQYAMLSGDGTVTGPARIAGTLSPGIEDAFNGVLHTENLTMADGAKIRINWTPEANAQFDVSGAFTPLGTGTIDFGMNESEPMPLSPQTKRVVLGNVDELVGGVEALKNWKVEGVGRKATSVKFEVENVEGRQRLAVTFNVSQGTLLMIR